MGDICHDVPVTDAPRTLRSRLGMLVAGVVWLGCVGVLAGKVATSGVVGALPSLPATLLVAFLAWLAFWAPSVRMSADGLVIRNLVRRNDLPWASITDVGVGMALTVSTARGRVVAWAAPSGSGGASRYGRGGAYSRVGSDSGDIAYLVLGRWVEMHRSGTIPREAGIEPAQRWLWAEIAVLVVLLVCAVITGILTR